MVSVFVHNSFMRMLTQDAVKFVVTFIKRCMAIQKIFYQSISLLYI